MEEINKNQEIAEAIKNRTKTNNGIYSDIGDVLKNYSTEELLEYFKSLGKYNGMLRDYIEDNITKHFILQEKYSQAR